MSDQNPGVEQAPLPKREGLRRAGKGIAFVVVVGGVAVTVALAVVVGIMFWQLAPRSSVGIDSPEIARPKFQAIEDRLSSELTGDNGNVVNNRFYNDDDGTELPETQEVYECDGPESPGEELSIRRKLDGPATQDDYETAIEVLESLPGWSSSSIDADSVEGLTQLMFTHEETGAIVVSLQEKASPPELAFWMMSGCYRE